MDSGEVLKRVRSDVFDPIGRVRSSPVSDRNNEFAADRFGAMATPPYPLPHR